MDDHLSLLLRLAFAWAWNWSVSERGCMWYLRMEWLFFAALFGQSYEMAIATET